MPVYIEGVSGVKHPFDEAYVDWKKVKEGAISYFECTKRLIKGKQVVGRLDVWEALKIAMILEDCKLKIYELEVEKWEPWMKPYLELVEDAAKRNKILFELEVVV